jgi:hypothetical protein
MKTIFVGLSFVALACGGGNITIQSQTCSTLQGAKCNGNAASFNACQPNLTMSCTSNADLDALQRYATCVNNAGMCGAIPPADYAKTLQTCQSMAGLSSGCASAVAAQAVLVVGGP